MFCIRFCTNVVLVSQVFSNVIATPSDGLKLVDMRGKQGDVLTLRGDVRPPQTQTTPPSSPLPSSPCPHHATRLSHNCCYMMLTVVSSTAVQ